MYAEYFGLKEAPFSIAPDPRYLYLSDQHREALAHLLYGVGSDGGFVLLTGEVGTGKTTVCRCLLEQMPSECDVAFIFNPKLTVEELLSTICDELRIPYPAGPGSVKVFIDRINTRLLEAHANGRKTVLIIDEAQRLSLEVLEQIRLLTNLETNQRKLLQVILLGQPELQEMLARPNLRQLSQRIIARYHLGALSRPEVGAYVKHRLAVAGGDGRLFPDSTLSRLFRLSRGIPRLVNVLCDRALLGTYAQGRRTVNQRTMAQAAREVFGETGRRSWLSRAAYGWVAAGLVVVAALLMVMVGRSNLGQPPRVEETVAPSDAQPREETVNSRPVSVRPDTEVALPPVATSAEQPVPLSLPVEPAATPVQPVSTGNETAPTRASSSVTEAETVTEPRLDPAPLTLFERFTDRTRRNSLMGAYQALFRLWGVTYKPEREADACQQAEASGLQCFLGTGDLHELRALNLPAVLQLKDDHGHLFHVALTAVRRGTATLALDTESAVVGVEEIASRWTGEYMLLWRPPPQYAGNLRAGDRGPMVKWLEVQLRRVQGKSVLLRTDPVLDPQLIEHVKKFQRSKGLKADGVVGPKTLIHLGSSGSAKIPHLVKRN